MFISLGFSVISVVFTSNENAITQMGKTVHKYRTFHLFYYTFLHSNMDLNNQIIFSY